MQPPPGSWGPQQPPQGPQAVRPDKLGVVLAAALGGGALLAVVFIVCVRLLTPPLPPEKVRAISAAALIAEYKANEVGADARWRGRLAQVTGVVDGIGKTFVGDTPWVTLSAGKDTYGNVTCWLQRDDEAAMIAKGAAVTYRCRISGYSLGDVQARDCAYVPLRPHP
jgi:hypothetical protein